MQHSKTTVALALWSVLVSVSTCSVFEKACLCRNKISAEGSSWGVGGYSGMSDGGVGGSKEGGW